MVMAATTYNKVIRCSRVRLLRLSDYTKRNESIEDVNRRFLVELFLD